MSSPETDTNNRSFSYKSSLGEHGDLRVESQLPARGDTKRTNIVIGTPSMDERENLELEPHALGQMNLNPRGELEGQQRTPDNEMVLYVDDRSTLIHCKCLRNIREITIVEITVGDDELNALRTCRSLTHISMLHCDGFDNLRVLAKISTLQAIYVYTRGSLQHIDSLNQLPALRKLILNCRNIDKRDIVVLEEMTTLEYISLLRINEVIYERGPNYIRSTIITDDNIRNLCENRSLVKIDFERCEELTDVALLAAVQTLECINLSYCFNVEGVGVLGRLSLLRELDVSHTVANDDSIRVLSESRSLVKINFEGCVSLTDVASLAAIQTLEWVNLSCCPRLKDVGVLGRLPCLKELDVRLTDINDDSIRGLSESRSLAKINFEKCKNLIDITPLAAIQTLEWVNLFYCFNVEHVGALGKLPCLKELDVRLTYINDDNMRELCESQSLVKIYFEGCENLKDVTPLVAIQTLECVHLSSRYILQDFAALGKLPRLKEFYAFKARITDDSMRQLSEGRSLVKIDLERCENLTDVTPLAAIQTLECVNFSYCLYVQNVGVFGKLPCLKELDVCETAVSDDGIRGLSESQSLVKINLEGCENVTDVTPLAAIQTLECVNFSYCLYVQNVGVFGKLPHLKEFYVRETAVSDDGIRGLSESQSLVKINLEGCENVTDVTPLAAIQTLECVNLSYYPNMQDIAVFGKIPRLKELDVSHTTFSKDDMRFFSGSQSLVKINLEGCENVTDVTPLAAIQTLECVNLSYYPNMQDIAVFGKIPRLKELDVSHTTFSKDDMRFFSGSQSLVKINLEKCENVTDVTPLAAIQTLECVNFSLCRGLNEIGALGKLPCLKELDVRLTYITDEGIRGLSESRSLVKISLEKCENVTDVTPLVVVQTLEWVNLSGCSNLMDVGTLGRLSRLKELDVRETAITDEGIRGLSESRSLVKINLGGCKDLTDVTPLAAVQTLVEVNIVCCRKVQTADAIRALGWRNVLYSYSGEVGLVYENNNVEHD